MKTDFFFFKQFFRKADFFFLKQFSEKKNLLRRTVLKHIFIKENDFENSF